MGAIALQLAVTIKLQGTGLIPERIKGFRFHYVSVHSGSGTELVPSGQMNPGINSDFVAEAYRSTTPHGHDPGAPSFTQLPDNVFQLKLAEVFLAVYSSSAPPDPSLRPGKYQLSSIQIISDYGSNYLWSGVDFDAETFPDAEIVVPEEKGSNPITVSALQVQVSPIGIP